MACQPSTTVTLPQKAKNEVDEGMIKKQLTAKNTPIEQWHKVTVKYFDFEGGFYGLVSKNGQKLLPMNLAKKYRVDGTLLEVKGHIIENMATIQQWGVAFKVTEVNLMELGKPADKHIL